MSTHHAGASHWVRQAFGRIEQRLGLGGPAVTLHIVPPVTPPPAVQPPAENTAGENPPPAGAKVWPYRRKAAPPTCVRCGDEIPGGYYCPADTPQYSGVPL